MFTTLIIPNSRSLSYSPNVVISRRQSNGCQHGSGIQESKVVTHLVGHERIVHSKTFGCAVKPPHAEETALAGNSQLGAKLIESRKDEEKKEGIMISYLMRETLRKLFAVEVSRGEANVPMTEHSFCAQDRTTISPLRVPATKMGRVGCEVTVDMR